MNKSILLTSFATWKPHQISNSSDDLLDRVSQAHPHPYHYLRKLPVDFQLAPKKVLARFEELSPDILVCCGMAEEREKLNIESRAVLDQKKMKTEVDLVTLVEGLPMTEISHDAGRFVCNRLYFEMLSHLGKQRKKHDCIFAHVPVLTVENTEAVTRDFLSLVERLTNTGIE